MCACVESLPNKEGGRERVHESVKMRYLIFIYSYWGDLHVCDTLQKLMGKSDPKFWVKTTATQITHYKGNSNLQNTLAKQP